jgi:hypothetical protein
MQAEEGVDKVPLTNEEKTELRSLIAEVMDSDRERRRQRFLEESKARSEAPITTRLHLITVHGRIAFPDERGRAVLNDVFYARVPLDESGKVGGFFSGRVEVVAFGDGKLLPKPIGVILQGGSFMSEVAEGFLETVL